MLRLLRWRLGFSGPLSRRFLISRFFLLMRRALRAMKTSAKYPNTSPRLRMTNLGPTHNPLSPESPISGISAKSSTGLLRRVCSRVPVCADRLEEESVGVRWELNPCWASNTTESHPNYVNQVSGPVQLT